MTQQNESNRPIHTLRFGGIKASIWKNQTRFGVMYNVTVARSYKDGELWKDSSSFSYDDLLTLAKAINECHSWIHEAVSNAKAGEPPI